MQQAIRTENNQAKKTDETSPVVKKHSGAAAAVKQAVRSGWTSVRRFSCTGSRTFKPEEKSESGAFSHAVEKDDSNHQPCFLLYFSQFYI